MATVPSTTHEQASEIAPPSACSGAKMISTAPKRASPRPENRPKKSLTSCTRISQTPPQSPPARLKASATHMMSPTKAVSITKIGLAASSSMAFCTIDTAAAKPVTSTCAVLNAAKPAATAAIGFHRSSTTRFRTLKVLVSAARISSPVPNMAQNEPSAVWPPCR